jgi:acetyl/propionyl-CoA carboxylase alpha subunit
VVIGGAPATESYLHIDRIISAAVSVGCDAIHPGYGFLAENGDFAEAVQQAGLVFIGPSPEVIRLLGNKSEARKAVAARGVQIPPGVPGGLSDATLLKEASLIGFPLIVKAVAGGGGRGMRIVRSLKELEEALPRVRAESKKFFANDDIYFERYIENPRHVEVQLFGDAQGAVVHFGTRECSLQRRHQKILEEAPAQFLSPALEEKILADAVAAAKSVGYTNAGTAEFLVSNDTHYFLEINTRIQVEHPVTELVTGVDLVALQLLVAAGNPLPMTQKEIVVTGHAIECRIYAEDPRNNFAPTRGTISQIQAPEESFFREDRGFEAGDVISLQYDALLTKLLVHGKNRAQAIARMRVVLASYSLTGLESSLLFHKWLFVQSVFVTDCFDIAFLDTCFDSKLLDSIDAIWEDAGSAVRQPRSLAP